MLRQGCILGALAICAATSALSNGAGLTILPDLTPGRPLFISRLTPDGQSVVGIDGYDLFRWSAAEGQVVIDQLPQSIGGLQLSPTSISSDGRAVLMQAPPGPQSGEAYCWTRERGLVNLGLSPSAEFGVVGKAASNAGAVVFGVWQKYEPVVTLDESGRFVQSLDLRAFRWSDHLGSRAVQGLNYVVDVSADGSAMTTARQFPGNKSESIIWTEAAGILGLGDLPNGQQNNEPIAISADGGVVVGKAAVANLSGMWRAYRWTATAGMQSLGTLGDGSEATMVSGDGKVVIGLVSDYVPFPFGIINRHESFLWDETHGMRRLREAFEDYGIHLGSRDEGQTHEALQISFDGKKILGRTSTTIEGTFPPLDRSHLWIANLQVPEPHGYSAIAFSILALLRMNSGNGSGRLTSNHRSRRRT